MVTFDYDNCKPTGKLYKYKGEKIGLMELSRNPLCKVSAQILKLHIDEGMEIEEAFKRKIRNFTNNNHCKVRYEYKGKELTANELFKLPECNLSDINQLRHRLSGGDFTVLEAVMIPINGKRRKYNLNPNNDKPASERLKKDDLTFDDIMKLM